MASICLGLNVLTTIFATAMRVPENQSILKIVMYINELAKCVFSSLQVYNVLGVSPL